MLSCPLCRHAGTDSHAEIGGLHYLACHLCGLVFQNPAQLPSLEEEKAEYLLHENDVDDPGYRAHLRRLADPLTAWLKPGAQGLDYGCGPGPALSVMLREEGYDMRHYDPIFADDKKLLKQQYDFVTCTEVAEHFHKPRREFQRLAGLLRPGGALGLMTQLLTDDIDFASWHYHREISHVAFYRPATLDYIAAEFGFRIKLRAENIAIMTLKYPDDA